MARLSRRTMLLGGSAWAFAGVGARAAERPSLPIPPELRADAAGSIELDARTGAMRFLGDRETATYGVNGPYLGPALRLRRGETAAVRVTNNLPENITMHWHGLIIPGAANGGPHQVIAPGKWWRTQFQINQPAATLWYHPHYYPSTAQLVIKGLAGLLIVDDEEADRLPLPSRWGVDDIPLIIQDRRFTADGQLFDRMNAIAVTNGYVGDIALVNGARYPEARAARGWIRLRILNGSNARGYRLGISDGRSFYVIASDGGLLASPVELKELPIYAGERFEMLVDGRDGRAFDVVTLPVAPDIMRLPPFDGPLPLVTIRPDGADGAGRLPSSLAVLPALPRRLPPLSQVLGDEHVPRHAGHDAAATSRTAGNDPKRQGRPGGRRARGQPHRRRSGVVASGAALLQWRESKAVLARADRFFGGPKQGPALADRGRTRPDAAPRAHPRLPVPHHLAGWQAAGTRACRVEGCRANLERGRL